MKNEFMKLITNWICEIYNTSNSNKDYLNHKNRKHGYSNTLFKCWFLIPWSSVVKLLFGLLTCIYSKCNCCGCVPQNWSFQNKILNSNSKFLNQDIWIFRIILINIIINLSWIHNWWSYWYITYKLVQISIWRTTFHYSLHCIDLFNRIIDSIFISINALK